MAKRLGLMFLGVVAGYATIMALSVGTTTLLQSMFEVSRSPNPPDWYHVFDFAYSILAMAVGGYVSAWVTKGSVSTLALASLFLILGAITALGGRDPVHPMAYQWAIAVLGPVLVMFGGYARSRGRDKGTQAAGED